MVEWEARAAAGRGTRGLLSASSTRQMALFVRSNRCAGFDGNAFQPSEELSTLPACRRQRAQRCGGSAGFRARRMQKQCLQVGQLASNGDTGAW